MILPVSSSPPGAVVITLEMVSILFNFYRDKISVTGRVDRLAEDIEETQKLHKDLVDNHLPNLPSDCKEINRDIIYDREEEIIK